MRFRNSKFYEAKDHIITALLLVFALVIMISRHQGGIDSIRKASVTTLSLLEEPLANIRIYRQALNTNTYLQRQNILLQDELARLRAIEEENNRLRALLGYQDRTEFDLLPVLIVGKKINGMNNSITINAGKDDNVKRGQPLVTSDGLVGNVILTNTHYSLVMPFYNKSFRVSARIQDNQAVGIVSWPGMLYGQLVMDFVPKSVDIEPGFIIETSGSSNQYPAGIPIGIVTHTEPETGKETQRIYLEPYVSLNDLAQGFIIQFEPDTTIMNLDEEFKGLIE